MDDEKTLETVTITLGRYKEMKRKIRVYQSVFKVTGNIGSQNVVIDSGRVKKMHSHLLRRIDKVTLI